jgi:CheY-like chemotaxis protein
MQGVQVDAAEHGAAALERLRACGPGHFHAVLMDVQMPVMDGYEATRQLRQDPRFAGLPVIAMTAHALAEERERCASAGMTGHLCKPVEPAALYAALARHFGGAELNQRASPVPQPAQPQPPQPLQPLQPLADAGRLAAVPGLDAAAGLRRAGGQLALYRGLLADFALEYAGFPAALEAQLADGSWREAERRAHTLHGLAATLGAERVGALAAQLERDCRAGAAAAANAGLARLAPPLLQLAAALGDALATEPEAAAEVSQDTAWLPAGVCTAGAGAQSAPPDDWLPGLRAMLAACDSGALALWAACRHEGESLLGRAAARRLGRALDQFDFDQALAVLSAAPQPEPAS